VLRLRSHCCWQPPVLPVLLLRLLRVVRVVVALAPGLS
jgi:hypothetical protein